MAENCNDCYKHEYVREISLSSINTRLTNNNIKIFPNPCKEIIHIDLQNYLVSKQVTFYDLNGKMIKVSQVHDGYVDISDLSQGIFFIAILKEGEWYKVKLIKE